MTKDFQIKYTSVEVIDKDLHVYDIHNCYKFKGVALTYTSETKIEFYFEKIVGEWVKEIDPKKITFVFKGLKYLEFSKFFFIEQSSTIDELGYKAYEDVDYDWLMSEEHFTGEQHFIFRFIYGEHIRVFSERIELLKEY